MYRNIKGETDPLKAKPVRTRIHLLCLVIDLALHWVQRAQRHSCVSPRHYYVMHICNCSQMIIDYGIGSGNGHMEMTTDLNPKMQVEFFNYFKQVRRYIHKRPIIREHWIQHTTKEFGESRLPTPMFE